MADDGYQRERKKSGNVYCGIGLIDRSILRAALCLGKSLRTFVFLFLDSILRNNLALTPSPFLQKSLL